ncbi:MAG: hypothetical protein IT495_05820 [Gammaproteobacteria bacterium]|nr:hypothetical protein [Gammaproteobacteria bacterium]
MRLFSHKRRPVHLGPYPLERLARSDVAAPAPAGAMQQSLAFADPANPLSLANAMGDYIALHDSLRDGPVMPDRAPIPEDPRARAYNLKGACYYLDASQVGICRIPAAAVLEQPVQPATAAAARDGVSAGTEANAMFSVRTWDKRQADTGLTGAAAFTALGHTHAVVILVAYARDARPGEPGEPWLRGAQPQRAAVLAAEIAAVLAGYLRTLGYRARAHTARTRELDFDALLLASGLGEIDGGNVGATISNPFVGTRFGLAVVSTDLELACDRPLARRGLVDDLKARGPGWWFGTGGARPGWRALSGADRPLHLGPYPMERIQRVDHPTTLIDEPNVPRVPKRHDMFVRAAHGDLGPGPQKALENFGFISKEPFSGAMLPLLAGMVPLQSGQTAPARVAGTDDPKANADAVKALLYYLGSDLVGIGPARPYCWYSHDHDGSPIEPYHRNAIVVLIDQGYETMEGASGDDWISGAQSMRAYMRCSLLGGIVAEHIRRLGWSARTHSVIEQDVLHIPVILNAGLGELSRIGELVLNPYVGPRFKSLVITTDLPLEDDKPIDFGLQDFCAKCNKCARECPCQAISYGDKIMFNGYEMWKPDTFTCAKYRTTNSGGAACGRCMKTCPWNIEGVLAERLFVWAAIHLPFTRQWIARLDDRLGNGRINPVKKWWFDLEIVDGKVGPARRANARELSLERKNDVGKQDIAVFPIHLVPPPGAPGPVPVDRAAGRKARAQTEAVAHARQRTGWQPPRAL